MKTMNLQQVVEESDVAMGMSSESIYIIAFIVFVGCYLFALLIRNKLKGKMQTKFWINIILVVLSLSALVYTLSLFDYSIGFTDGVNVTYFWTNIVFVLTLVNSILSLVKIGKRKDKI